MSGPVALLHVTFANAVWVQVTSIINSAGICSLTSKTGCDGWSLGRSSLTDTKKSFIEFTSLVMSPFVLFFARPCISFVLPDDARSGKVAPDL